MRALRPVFILASRFRPSLYMNAPEHTGDILVQLADGALTPPPGHVYASLLRGRLTFPGPSALERANEELPLRYTATCGIPDG